MKTALLSMAIVSALSWTDAAAAAAGGEDRERGLRLYQEGKFAEAQQAFAAALAEEPDSGELQWNLALAAWRAGDLATAEVAAEKYAAQVKDAKTELHRGLLGAIRFAETEQLEQAAQLALRAPGPAGGPGQAAPGSGSNRTAADPLELLQQALGKARQAKNHFVRGARANATPELVRNTERALAKIKELERLIEELEKQRQDQQQEEGDKNPDDKQPEDGDEESDEEKGGDGEESKSPQEQPESPQEQEEQGNGQEDPGEQESEQSNPGEKSEESKPREGEEAPEQPEPQPEEQQSEQGGEQESGEQESGEQESGKQESSERESEGQDPGQQGQPNEGKEGDPSSSPQPKDNGESGQQGKRADGQPPESDPSNPEAGDSSDSGAVPDPPEPNPAAKRSDAPGEGGRGLELTPEQAQRLLERLKKLDEKLRKARARRSNRRRVVERDW